MMTWSTVSLISLILCVYAGWFSGLAASFQEVSLALFWIPFFISCICAYISFRYPELAMVSEPYGVTNSKYIPLMKWFSVRAYSVLLPLLSALTLFSYSNSITYAGSGGLAILVLFFCVLAFVRLVTVLPKRNLPLLTAEDHARLQAQQAELKKFINETR